MDPRGDIVPGADAGDIGKHMFSDVVHEPRGTLHSESELRVTLSYMGPTDYAAEEIELWQEALRDQREAEQIIDAAYAIGQAARVLELLPQVRVLRTRADLLLAQAVKIKCVFRDHSFIDVEAATTQSGLQDCGSPGQ